MAHKIMSLGVSNIVSKAKAPTAVSVAPANGAQAGGDAVVITGTNFKESANPAVTIGGVAATSVVVTSATTISCVTPAHAAGAVNVVVTNDNTGDGYSLTGTGVGIFTYDP